MTLKKFLKEMLIAAVSFFYVDYRMFYPESEED
jgi:hypothetical protein